MTLHLRIVELADGTAPKQQVCQLSSLAATEVLFELGEACPGGVETRQFGKTIRSEGVLGEQ